MSGGAPKQHQMGGIVPAKRKKRRGVRRYFSRPKKGCRTYGSNKNWRYAMPLNHLTQSNPVSVETIPNITQPNVVPDKDCTEGNDSSKPQLQVLSLYDGISSGYFALSRRLGLDVGNYFSAEIDKDALLVQQFHFFEEITPVGDVTHLSRYCLKQFGEINLLLAGSPCNHLSKANPLRKKLYDPDGTGILFFEFIRIREILQAEAECKGHLFFWMFENVTNLDSDTLQDLNIYLGCSPIKMIPSSSTRTRYFWGNIPGMQDKHMDIRENFLPLQHFLKPFRLARVDLLPTITTCSNSTKKKGMDGDDALVFQNGEPSYLFTTEIEQIFNFPQHFTDVANLSASRRLKLLGKTWDIDLIEKLLEPLCSLFRKKISNAS